MKYKNYVVGLASVVLATSTMAGAIHSASLFTNTLAANDDESTSQVALGFAVKINSTTYTETYVNNNGNITFNNALSTFIPAAINNGSFGPIIAPYFADVDTRGSGSSPVRYGSSVIDGKKVFGVNYINVGAYSQQPFYNDFQVILTDRSDVGVGNFDIQFNYDKVVWDATTSQLGEALALVGYWTSATSNRTLSGSLVKGALIDGGSNALTGNSLNSETSGRYNFQVRDGAVVSDDTNDVPEPGTLALMGLALLVSLGTTLGKKRSA